MCCLACSQATGTPDAGTDGGGADSGGNPADAGAGTVCSRAAQAATADVALLDALESSLATAAPGAEAALVSSFLSNVATSGGTPLQTRDGGTRVAFVVNVAPDAGWSIAGSWNGWTPGMLPMQPIADGGLYVVEADLPRASAYQYKPVDGTTFYEDLLARNVVWDGIDHQGPGQFNGVVYAELQAADAGRLVAWRGVHSTLLDDDRDVFVYLPAGYDEESCPTLPSLYFTDGNESLTRVPFQAAADDSYAQVPGDSAVLVFAALPNQNVRIYQYTFGPDAGGDLYLDFLKRDLRPLIQGAYRVCPAPADTGMAGASLGGLMAAYGAFQMPDVFDYVGSQSGSFFWDNDALVARAQDGGLVPARFYLDTGCPDTLDNCISNELMEQALQSRGYPLLYIEQDGGQHDWSYWQPRLPNLLHFFREGDAGCSP